MAKDAAGCHRTSSPCAVDHSEGSAGPAQRTVQIVLNILGSADAQRALAFAIVSVIDVGLFVLVFLVLRSRRIGFRLAAAVIALTALAYLVSLVVFLGLSLRS